MIKIFKILFITLFFLSCKTNQKDKETIITTDVDNFWKAYDQIKTTNDSTKQATYLKELFLEKGTPGLKGIMQARRYTVSSYLTAIQKYPKFWESLRANTSKVNSYKEGINKGIQSFKSLYLKAKPAKIFFTIGAFKTGGTTIENKVLIGSEIALGDKTVVTSELKEDFPNLPRYFKTNIPEESIVFGNVHEYVHTQQDTTIGNSLLSKTLIEGVAEFVAEKALNISSPNESIIYGKENDEKIKQAFVKEMFTKYEIRWFWSNTNNQFKVGDLGYYIGYAISKKYYEQAKDKKKAIEEMIELDYLDEDELYDFIDKSKYFDKSIVGYYKESEEKRPRVIGIEEFENNSKNVNSNIKTMTVEFSKEMDGGLVNLRLGPLGEDNLLQVTNNLGWSEDNRKITFEVMLKPNLRQQLLITDIFRSKDGYLLAPYLVDITTE
ncbi:hypothetical protein [uncultured Tenacibaculum sp.]|uniref:gliding motility protein GldB-related protein n=1 Tax=uncultured Tenacibaculum sp. TaxID=174713 RepID=UPI00261EF504|nr:hypothetical protein [uncultured Tenacibaculum sp.]